MKKIDLGQTIGIFANIGVIASLVFVGLQLRQSQQIALASQYQARAQSQMDMFMTHMQTGFVPVPQRVATELDPQSIAQINFILTSADNTHFQYEAGFLTEEAWQA